MVNSLKRLNKGQIIGLIIEVVSFIGCCIDREKFVDPFWIGTSIHLLGSILFINLWSKEGKTWFKKMDKKYSKNLTRRPSDSLFFLEVLEMILVCSIFMLEFWIEDLSRQLPVIIWILILTVVCMVVALIIVDKTYKQVNALITSRRN